PGSNSYARRKRIVRSIVRMPPARPQFIRRKQAGQLGVGLEQERHPVGVEGTTNQLRLLKMPEDEV
ncbi:MAG: hypothetical protein L0H63_14255, partial [Nitrococcus sp.]|nr:hypothetical protein [Nitrococcus sp.]